MKMSLRRSLFAVASCAAVIASGCSSDDTASTDPIIVVETLPGTTASDAAAGSTAQAGGTSTDAPIGSSAAGTDEEKLAEFSQCMRDNGVEAFEDPVVNADGSVELFADPTQAQQSTSDPEFNAAYDACINMLEGASFVTDQSEAEAEDSLVKLAACLRERGIEVDDPNFDAENPADMFGADLDLNDPAVNAAMNECSQEVYTDTSGGQ